MTERENTQTGPPSHYTREGDDGRTNFGAYGTCSKHDARVVAYEECDEANSSVSVAIALGGLPNEVSSTLVSVQNDLFDVGADLATPYNSGEGAKARIVDGHIERLERAIEHFSQQAKDLSGLVLPGGTLSAATLFQARGIVRRAERTVWDAYDQYPQTQNPLIGRYLNRLSSLLFILARGANAEHGDIIWVPEASVRPVDGQDQA